MRSKGINSWFILHINDVRKHKLENYVGTAGCGHEVSVIIPPTGYCHFLFRRELNAYETVFIAHFEHIKNELCKADTFQFFQVKFDKWHDGPVGQDIQARPTAFPRYREVLAKFW